MKHCKISWTEAWNMPVELRKWWLGRTAKEGEKASQQQKSK